MKNTNLSYKRKVIFEGNANYNNTNSNHIVSNLNDIDNKILIAPENEANNQICTGNMTQKFISTVVVLDSDGRYSCVQCD